MESTVAAPAAGAVLRAAHEDVYRWPTGFAGFVADVDLTASGSDESWTGRVWVRSGELPVLELEEAPGPDRTWAAEQIHSIATHRSPLAFEAADGRFAISDRPTGPEAEVREIAVDDGLDSVYTLRDGAIERIERTVGDLRLMIAVQCRERAPRGRVASRTTVVARGRDDDAPRWVEIIDDAFTAREGVLLPAGRRGVRIAGDGVRSRVLRLSGHTLLAEAVS